MTSDKLVDHRVDLAGQLAQLVAALDVGVIVRAAPGGAAG